MSNWSQVESLIVDITEDADKSSSVSLGEFNRGSVQTPAALTSTALSWQVSNDNTNWFSVRDDSDNAIAAKTVTASEIYNIPAQVFKSRYGRISLGSNEVADRTFLVNLAGD